MHLLFTDETNRSPSESKEVEFFIYGGLAVPVDSALDLHRAIEGIRTRHGFDPTDTLKFARTGVSDHVTKEAHTVAKKAVIRSCEEVGATFFASVCHHGIAKRQGFAQTLKMNSNTVLGAFAKFLEERTDCGLVLADRTDEGKPFDYLRERFQVGLKMHYGQCIPLDNLIAFGQTCDGASHFSSAADIVLGAFRYVVNHRERHLAGNALLPGVVRLLWKSSEGKAINYGLNLRPVHVRSPVYKAAYHELREYLSKANKAAMVVARREALGWTQHDLAAAAQVSRSTISHIETRRNYDSLKVVHMALAEAEAEYRTLANDRPAHEK